MVDSYRWDGGVVVGGSCDFSVSPSPNWTFWFGTALGVGLGLALGGLGLGVGLDKNNWTIVILYYKLNFELFHKAKSLIQFVV